MNKRFTTGLALAFLAVGIVLIIFGLNASHSLGSDVSRTFTGSPTNKTTWLMVGGVACGVIGLVGLFWKGGGKG